MSLARRSSRSLLLSRVTVRTRRRGRLEVRDALFSCPFSVLRSCNNDVESAVGLGLAMAANEGRNEGTEDDEDGASARLAARLAAEDAAGGEEVRAAMPQTYDTLYGESTAGTGAGMPRWQSRSLEEERPAFAVDDAGVGGSAAARRRTTRAAAAAAAANDDDGAPGAQPGSALADLFKPPVAILFKGANGFEGAKQHARELNRYLVVNIQSEGEFASHALNRDVWADELVQSAVASSFVLYQVGYATEEGQRLHASYRCTTLPTIFGVDPLTGMACAFQWTPGEGENAMLTPERMLTMLEPLMLLSGPNSGEPPPPIPSGGFGGSRSAAAQRPSAAVVDMDEDAQLAAAIAASLENGGAGPGPSSDDPIPIDVTAADAPPSPPPLAEEPAAAVESDTDAPDEPASGPRVALRLPDGTRVMRRFAADDVLWDVRRWARSRLGGDFGFRWHLARAPPSSGPVLPTDRPSLSSLTVADAGVDGCVLSVVRAS